tara:strand:- start:80 stop:316 length:237 start_codon:yes stop_codon:yes gene_type:complete
MAEPIMQENDRPKITINDTEYFVDTLSDDVKRLIGLYQRADQELIIKKADISLLEISASQIGQQISELLDGNTEKETG